MEDIDKSEVPEQHFILCCVCGTQIAPNPANMCVNCLRTEVDITEGISKQVTIFFCKNCGRYQKPPWVVAELESKELLAICLKKISGLNKDIKLVEAKFKYTEPHSRRLKVELTVQKQVFASAILQQVFVVTFICSSMQCPDCERSYTEHTWQAICQVRQKVPHKRTFFALEQLLLKSRLVEKAMGVKEVTDGLDFYFLRLTDCEHLKDFLLSVCVAKVTESRKLISQDDNSNTKKFKFTRFVEIAPVCRYDLVELPKKLTQQLGGTSPLMLVTKVSNSIYMVDVVDMKSYEIAAQVYWRYHFKAIAHMSHCQEFTVLDVQSEADHGGNPFTKQAQQGKWALCEAEVVKSDQIGDSDAQKTTVSHLGRIIDCGDLAMGYDMKAINWSGTSKTLSNVDVVLTKKHYPKVLKRAKKRTFELKRMDVITEEVGKIRKAQEIRNQQDYELFLQEIEENPEMRKNMNLFKRQQMRNPDTDSESELEEDYPSVNPAELLLSMASLDIQQPISEESVPPLSGPSMIPAGATAADIEAMMDDDL